MRCGAGERQNVLLGIVPDLKKECQPNTGTLPGPKVSYGLASGHGLRWQRMRPCVPTARTQSQVDPTLIKKGRETTL